MDGAGVETAGGSDEFSAVLAKWQASICSQLKIEGRGLAVLDAMAWCAMNDRPAPAWLAKRFLERLDAYKGFEVATLDEAFDAKRPKGLKLAAARQQLHLQGEAVARMVQLRAGGTSAATALDQVADELRISVALLKKYLADHAKRAARIAAPIPPAPSAAEAIFGAIASAIQPQTRKTKKHNRAAVTKTEHN